MFTLCYPLKQDSSGQGTKSPVKGSVEQVLQNLALDTSIQAQPSTLIRTSLQLSSAQLEESAPTIDHGMQILPDTTLNPRVHGQHSHGFELIVPAQLSPIRDSSLQVLSPPTIVSSVEIQQSPVRNSTAYVPIYPAIDQVLASTEHGQMSNPNAFPQPDKIKFSSPPCGNDAPNIVTMLPREGDKPAEPNVDFRSTSPQAAEKAEEHSAVAATSCLKQAQNAGKCNGCVECQQCSATLSDASGTTVQPVVLLERLGCPDSSIGEKHQTLSKSREVQNETQNKIFKKPHKGKSQENVQIKVSDEQNKTTKCKDSKKTVEKSVNRQSSDSVKARNKTTKRRCSVNKTIEPLVKERKLDDSIIPSWQPNTQSTSKVDKQKTVKFRKPKDSLAASVSCLVPSVTGNEVPHKKRPVATQAFNTSVTPSQVEPQRRKESSGRSLAASVSTYFKSAGSCEDVSPQDLPKTKLSVQDYFSLTRYCEIVGSSQSCHAV